MQDHLNIAPTQPDLAPGKRASVRRLLNLSSVSLKLRLFYLTALAASLLLLILCLYGVVRRSELSNGISYLKEQNSLHQNQLTEYFNSVGGQILLLSENPLVKDAFASFQEGFQLVEEEVYSLPGVKHNSEAKRQLEEFYLEEVIRDPDEELQVTSILPNNNNALFLQYLYIVHNRFGAANAYRLNDGGDYSTYSSFHAEFHPMLREKAADIGVSDILLIDPQTGNIIYTVFKKPDFGANIMSGVFENSSLHQLYLGVLASSSKKFLVSDIEQNILTGSSAKAYVGVPIFNEQSLTGVMIVRLDASTVSNLINPSSIEKTEKLANKAKVSYLIGNDFSYRTNDSRLVTDKIQFLSRLKKAGWHREVIDNIDSLNSVTGKLNLPGKLFSQALLGYTTVQKFRDVTAVKSFAAVSAMNIGGNNFFLVVQIARKEMLKNSRRVFFIGIAATLLLILAVSYISLTPARYVDTQINSIKSFGSQLLKGKLNKNIKVSGTDDFAGLATIMEKLTHRIQQVEAYALQLAEGETSISFAEGSEEDRLAISLNKLKESIENTRINEEKRKAEDEIRNWVTHGIAHFNDLLRMHNDDIDTFTFHILKNLIEYLSANQGAFYLLEGRILEDKNIVLKALYAYNRRKHLNKEIAIGEGLVGNCALEKQTTYLKEVPSDYIEIGSGLGHAKPRALLIVPMINKEEVIGVLEIASFNELEKHEIEFAEKVAENTATTIISVQLNMRTKELLNESNERAEELAAQEEEMRQNLEELKATQEEMIRIKGEEALKEKKNIEDMNNLLEELKVVNKELHSSKEQLEFDTLMFNTLLNSFPGRVSFKDPDGKYLRINKTKVKALGISDEKEIIGKSDYDVFGSENAKAMLEMDKAIIRSGAPIMNKEEVIRFKDGRITWGSTSRLPFRSNENNVIGFLEFTWDITEQKNAEFSHEVEKQLFSLLSHYILLIRYRIDNSGLITEIEGRGLDAIGFSPVDLIGKEFIKLYPEAAGIKDAQIEEKPFAFTQTVNQHVFKHFIYKNKSTDNGYNGIAYDTRIAHA